jgi:hypothetical protein
MLEISAILYTSNSAQLVTRALIVTNLQQTCSNAVSTTCHQDVLRLICTACSQLVDKLSTVCLQLSTRLLSSTDLLQVVPITCYHHVIQQFVNKLRVTTL